MVSDDYNPCNTDEVEHKDHNIKNGILINSVYPLTDCHDKLIENDVLLSIDGIHIGEDGTIKYPFPEDGVSRINYTYITSNKFCGDMVELKILRNGKEMCIKVMVDIIDYLVPIVLYDRPVTYYIFGGFVFLPLSRPYLRAEYGSKWSSKCAVRLKDLYFNGYKEEKEEEVVILSRVLASDINVGYHKFTNCVLEKVNGGKVKNIKQLIEIIHNASVDKSSKFIHFLFEHNVTMVLEIDIAIEGTDKIMKEHKIKHDRSQNLRNPSTLKRSRNVDPAKRQKMNRIRNHEHKSQIEQIHMNENDEDCNKAMQIIDEITSIFGDK